MPVECTSSVEMERYDWPFANIKGYVWLFGEESELLRGINWKLMLKM